MVEVKVSRGPCCFCALDILPTAIDPCRVQITTASGKPQIWFCHAACFKQKLTSPPQAPGLFDPVHF